MTNFVFLRRPWVLMTWERKTLGTCDTPVILTPDPSDTARGIGPTLGTAREVLIPLSRHDALLLGELGGEGLDFRGPGNAMLANRLNRQVLLSARREAFHHPRDAPFQGFDVPSPRESEMVDSTDQIDALVRAFAKHQGRPDGLPG